MDKSIFERTVPDTSEQTSERVPEPQKAPAPEVSSLEMNNLRAALNQANTKGRVLDIIPTPVMTIDKDFKVTYLNQAGLDIVKLTPDSVIGKRCYEIFNTEHCNTPNCQVAKAMRDNNVFTSDTIANLSSGKLPIRYTGAPLKDENGHIIGGLEYVLDITKEVMVTQSVTQLSDAAQAGQLDSRADLDQFDGNYRNIVKGINDTLDAVISPLNVAAEYIDRIGKGDIPGRITDDYKGDFNEIKNNLNLCIDSINGLINEAGMLTKAAKEGQLDIRGDASKFSGDYAGIVQGVNDTLDAVIGPLNVAAEYIDRIGKGDIPERITDDYYGDFNEIKNNLNLCIDSVNGLIAETGLLTKAAKDGQLDIRGDASKFSGDYAGIIQGINDTLDAVIGPLNVAAEYIDRIGKGDIPERITDDYHGDFNEIKNNLNLCIDSINGLVAEIIKMTDVSIHGRLDVRGDFNKFSGDYQGIIKGINQTVETLVSHIDKIPTPVMIIDKDFGIQYINQTGASIIGLPQEQLINQKCYSHFKTNDCQNSGCACGRAMMSGKTETSETDAHPGKHDLDIKYTGTAIRDQKGDVCGALEIVIDQTEVKKAIADAQIKVEYLNNVPTPVMIINKEFTVQFINPAGSKVLNRTLDSCIGQKCFNLFNTKHCQTPECQVAKAMNQNCICTGDTTARLSTGELPVRYTGAPLKDASGNIIGGLEYVIDITKEMDVTNGVLNLVDAALDGKLDTRANSEDFEGNYQRIVKGVNDLLDAVISPLNVAAEYIDRISKGDIPDKISDTYKGDFNEIKNNINMLIDAMNNVTKLAQDIAIGKMNISVVKRSDRDTLMIAISDMLASMKRIVSVTKEIAQGNLRIQVKKRSEEDELMSAFRMMIRDLTNIAENVQTAASQVATGSQEISASAQQVSQGSTEQAASVEEVSSSMEEMSSTVSQNADNARETAAIASKAAVDAQEGGKSVVETVSAMRSIAEKISIIEEIARQTNMLALNAAIEAARAGEHGKGFAVVAAEVRKLAERSQSAAKEISTLSGTSVEIAEKAGKVIQEIVPGIQKTAELVEEINVSSAEQADGIQQVTKAIQQLDHVIQQSASISEEMASTSEELTAQAEQLREASAFFKIDSRGAASPRTIQHAPKQSFKPERKITPGISAPVPKNQFEFDDSNSGVMLDMNDDDSDFERY
jgi:methyl-accepting chemotaxis protein